MIWRRKALATKRVGRERADVEIVGYKIAAQKSTVPVPLPD